MQETFEFDWMSIEPMLDAAPTVTACPASGPDTAWIDMPFVRNLRVTGYPDPDLVGKPAQLGWDPTTGVTAGWTPSDYGDVEAGIEASNTFGNDAVAWTVTVES